MKTIIEMAREAGIDWHRHWNDDESNRLEAFAALVRAEAQAEEREACAKVCENEWGTLAEKEAGLMYAAAIRAGGNT